MSVLNYISLIGNSASIFANVCIVHYSITKIMEDGVKGKMLINPINFPFTMGNIIAALMTVSIYFDVRC
jgi:hypothetical protein